MVSSPSPALPKDLGKWGACWGSHRANSQRVQPGPLNSQAMKHSRPVDVARGSLLWFLVLGPLMPRVSNYKMLTPLSIWPHRRDSICSLLHVTGQQSLLAVRDDSSDDWLLKTSGMLQYYQCVWLFPGLSENMYLTTWYNHLAWGDWHKIKEDDWSVPKLKLYGNKSKRLQTVSPELLKMQSENAKKASIPLPCLLLPWGDW